MPGTVPSADPRLQRDRGTAASSCSFVLLLAAFGGVARGGGPAAQLPLPCGLPQAAPLWVDYADGQVPFWSTIFARPGRRRRRVGPDHPAAAAREGRADRLLRPLPEQPRRHAVAAGRPVDDPGARRQALRHGGHVVGLRPPADRARTSSSARRRRRRGRRRPRSTARTCSPTCSASPSAARARSCCSRTARTRATRSRTSGGATSRKVADLVSETYFSGPSVSQQGAVAGSRRMRATLRSRHGEPDPDRHPDQPARRDAHLQLDAARRRPRGAAAARALARRRQVGGARRQAGRRASCNSRASGRGGGRRSTRRATTRTSRSPPAPGSGRATTRSATRPRSPVRSSTSRSTSARCCRPNTVCLLGKTKLLATDVAALARLTGDRELAFSAELQHAVLAEARPVATRDVAAGRARRDRRPLPRQPAGVPLGARRSSRVAGTRATGSWRTSCGAALSRPGCACPRRRPRSRRPGSTRTAPTSARAVRVDRSVDWLGDARSGIALSQDAPGRIFTLAPGESVTIRGARVTALGEAAPLGAFPYAQAGALRPPRAADPGPRTSPSRPGRAAARTSRSRASPASTTSAPQPRRST